MTSWRRLIIAACGLSLVGMVSLFWPETSWGQILLGPGVDALGDPLPARAYKRLGTSRLRHGSRILALTFSADGKVLAAGGGDDPVRLWETATGKEIQDFQRKEIRFPEPWVHALAVDPDKRFLATAGAFKTIRLWDFATGRERQGFKGHKTPVKALALSAEKNAKKANKDIHVQFLASLGQDGTHDLWDIVQGGHYQLKGHNQGVSCLALSGDYSVLATGSSDGQVRLWDLEVADLDDFQTEKPLHSFDAKSPITSVAFAGIHVAVACEDNVIRLWNVIRGKYVGEMKGHQDAITAMASGGDGKILISASSDLTLRFWDVATLQTVQTIFRDRGDGDALALSPDGKILACAGLHNTIRLFDGETGKEVEKGNGHRAPISGLALSPDGKSLISGAARSNLRVWDLTSGKEIRRWNHPTAGELVLAYAPDGKTVATAADPPASSLSKAGDRGVVRLWDAHTGAELDKIPGQGEDQVLSLAFAPDGKSLAIGQRRQGIRLWDLGKKQIFHQVAYAGPVYALAFAPSGDRLAGSGGSKIAIWNTMTGQLVKDFENKEGPPATLSSVTCLAFSPDGQTVAAGCYDAGIRILDINAGKEIRALDGHQSAVFSLAFSPDGRLLVSGSFDKTVRIWETFSGFPVGIHKGHAGPVNSLVFSPQGRTVISGSVDSTILFWDITGLGDLSKEGQLPALNLGPNELQQAWNDLAAEEGSRGQKAVWELTASPAASVPYLASQIYLVDPRKIAQLLGDLNADEFNVREQATKELANKGKWIEDDLLDSLKNPPSEEVRRRLLRLLEQLRADKGITIECEKYRVRRAMLVLEQIGDAPAQKFLEKLAQGAARPELRAEARASLDRLAKRK